MNVRVEAGAVFLDTTDEDEAELDAAWANDPTKSKSRYYKRRRQMRVDALDAAGFRYGKPHWCGGSGVLYSIAEWQRWDEANPVCEVGP
ncbi:MAG: hypothetical protein E6G61_00795 [Actinobacteria bacterium]|nr:MAG: hypothetical protein E6G61_00795 [Actinomycetota bacterium]